MFHIVHGTQQESYDVAVLVKRNALKDEPIEKHYINPTGLNKDRFISFSLEQQDYRKKPKAVEMKAYLAQLLPILKDLKVKMLYVTDGNWFKTLTKKSKVDPYFGYAIPCAIPGYEDMQVTVSANYQALIMNDRLQPKIDLANKVVKDYLNGSYEEIGTNIIKHYERIPNDPTKIQQALEKLKQYDSLTCDTEAFSLRHTEAGLGTIGFAWNKHEGICIDVEHNARRAGSSLGFNKDLIKNVLREFFESYQGRIIYHNASYDIKILIYYLFMEDMLDTEGLLNGLEVMTKNFEDTKLITYLATNNCGENSLSLKDQAHEYAGNYAQDDINDIMLIPNDVLMKYNLVDCLSTWFVYEKHYGTMINDNQLDTYIFFKKVLKNIIQMELTGMPLNMERVKEVDKILLDIIRKYRKVLNNSPVMKHFNTMMRKRLLDEKNAKLKTKQLEIWDIEYTFNPGSNKQLIALLHDYLGFDVHSTTKTGQPAVGGDELKGHMNRSDDPQVKEVIEAILKILEGQKIRNTFISKFLDAVKAPDGWHYLFGSINLGGTKSGRLSSSNPNLQNLPSGSTYGKLIKSCFQAPPGWVWLASDFNALEDRVNTLLTKDPNKLKIYLEEFDGHCLRAYSYFSEQMPDIDPESKDSINSIKDKYGKLRGKSKGPSFSMQYLGTPHTLVVNNGFTKEEADTIYDRYHKLYTVSDKWVQAKIDEAAMRGYTELAFGLRLRCPLLQKTVLGTKYTPAQAEAEKRTVANAVSGQSYGLLNSRAGVEFQQRVIDSKFKLDIKPCIQIHDAIYLLAKDTLETVKWVNDNLIECMAWNELPELYHETVSLGSELDVHYGSWAQPITLPNNATYETIVDTIAAKRQKYDSPN